MQTTEQSPDIVPGRGAGKSGGFLDFLKELPVLIVVAFAIALVIKTFLVQAFFIPSASMQPTLEIGDRVLVSKFSYRFSEPRPGDVVVFASPLQEGLPRVDRGPVGNFLYSLAVGLGLRSSERDFIKRVIALEGDVVQVKGGAVHVNGARLNEPYLKDGGPMPDYGPYKVPGDTVFVMGDNRANSQDSRVFGAIKRSSIVGKAFVMVWPPTRVGLL